MDWLFSRTGSVENLRQQLQFQIFIPVKHFIQLVAIRRRSSMIRVVLTI